MKTPRSRENTFLDKLLHRIDRVDPDNLQHYLQRQAREKGFLETIFNSLQEGVVVLDPEARIIYANHSVEKLVGIRPSQAVGEPIAKFLRELDWKRLLNETQTISRDLDVTYPEVRYLNLHVVPLRENPDGLNGFVLIFHDLTATREKTRETIESERLNALTLLAAGVAHELGNPLNSINIHFQLLERDLRKLAGFGDSRTADSLQVIQSEITRLDLIIHQFLRAVRPTAPNLKPEPLNAIVQESVRFLQPEITDRDIIVETDFDSHLPLASVDRDRMKQAFYNLIKNAVQAMPTGSILRITTELSDTHIIVSFADSGTGIAPEDMSRIFEPYFTTKSSGSGLGLLIVRRIVREHGGELELESHVGRGTTVRVLLPRTERRVRMLPPSHSTTAENPGG